MILYVAGMLRASPLSSLTQLVNKQLLKLIRCCIIKDCVNFLLNL